MKLTDFGFAKKIQNRTFTLCGTPEYLAPEVLLNQGHGKPVDWWTLGVLLYEMLAGIDPFSDKDPMSVYHNILKGKLRFPKDFDPDAKSLVKHLLVSDLSKRYGNLKNGTNILIEVWRTSKIIDILPIFHLTVCWPKNKKRLGYQLLKAKMTQQILDQWKIQTLKPMKYLLQQTPF